MEQERVKWEEGGRGGRELGWFYGRASRARIGPSSGFCCEPRSTRLWTIQHLSSVCNAHSIISVKMSARAGGPRNTHQPKDYPSFQRLLVCHLLPIPTAAPSGRPFLLLFFFPSLPLCRLMGKMICEQKINCPRILRWRNRPGHIVETLAPTIGDGACRKIYNRENCSVLGKNVWMLILTNFWSRILGDISDSFPFYNYFLSPPLFLVEIVRIWTWFLVCFKISIS